MIVVSDTTIFRYLVLIKAVEVIPRLFDEVHVPTEVIAELGRSQSPTLEIVRQWANSPPPWVRVSRPSQIDDDVLRKLDLGEAQAIALAEEIKADLLLIDEKQGRKVARERGLRVVGTLAVLEEAAVRDYLDIEKAIDRLRDERFRASEKYYQLVVQNTLTRKFNQK